MTEAAERKARAKVRKAQAEFERAQSQRDKAGVSMSSRWSVKAAKKRSGSDVPIPMATRRRDRGYPPPLAALDAAP